MGFAAAFLGLAASALSIAFSGVQYDPFQPAVIPSTELAGTPVWLKLSLVLPPLAAASWRLTTDHTPSGQFLARHA